jgi:hypothetical protein
VITNHRENVLEKLAYRGNRREPMVADGEGTTQPSRHGLRECTDTQIKQGVM